MSVNAVVPDAGMEGVSMPNSRSLIVAALLLSSLPELACPVWRGLPKRGRAFGVLRIATLLSLCANYLRLLVCAGGMRAFAREKSNAQRYPFVLVARSGTIPPCLVETRPHTAISAPFC